MTVACKVLDLPGGRQGFPSRPQARASWRPCQTGLLALLFYLSYHHTIRQVREMT